MEINISLALQIEQPETQGPRAICQDQQGARYPDNSFYSKHLTKFIPIHPRAPAGRRVKKKSTASKNAPALSAKRGR